MRCPYCGVDQDKVIDSRSVREGRAVRRRRECLACGERFTTYEAVEAHPVLVVKRDGRREPYDRNKLMAGLAKACEKRPVAMEVLEEIVDEVERGLVRSRGREVETQAIGRFVLDRLRDVDEVAYVRFASVYRSFQNVEEFLAELHNLQAARHDRP
jgi:transcriptional repressor NrdR